jgi:aromatic ring hydroxylase
MRHYSKIPSFHYSEREKGLAMIKTKEDYINSLKKLNHVVYYKGKRVKDVTTHPAFTPHINAAAKTYDLARVPEYEDLMTATSHLTGKKINRFTHIHQSSSPTRRGAVISVASGLMR